MIKYEDILKIIDPIFVSTVNIITWDKFNEFVDTLNKKIVFTSTQNGQLIFTMVFPKRIFIIIIL